MKHINANNSTDFWTTNDAKGRASSYSQYQKAYKNRRASTGQLDKPFSIPGAPQVVLKDMVAPGDNSKTVEMIIDMRFTADDLERYDALNQTADLFKGCRGKERLSQLQQILAMELRFLLSCDQAATHPKQPVSDTEAAQAVLPDGDNNDASDNKTPANNGEASSPPANAKNQPPAAPAFTLWLPYNPEAIRWNDLGFSDAGASDREDFMPACAFFFYIDILPKKFPKVSNALHAAWMTKHKNPMSAEGLAQPPLTFAEETQEWYKATIEYLRSKLTVAQREERGITDHLQAATGTARTKARTKATEIAKSANEKRRRAEEEAAEAAAGDARARVSPA